MQREDAGRREGHVKVETEKEVNAATSQGTRGATRHRRKQGRILSQTLRRECSPASTLILDFWPQELGENKCVLFLSHQIWVDLLQQPRETNLGHKTYLKSPALIIFLKLHGLSQHLTQFLCIRNSGTAWLGRSGSGSVLGLQSRCWSERLKTWLGC